MANDTKSKGRPGSRRGADGKFISNRKWAALAFQFGDIHTPHNPQLGASMMQVIAALLTAAIMGALIATFWAGAA